jgi:PleD family two-component response regulator
VVSDTGAIRFTVSIGVASCSPRFSLKDAIVRADKALYSAKKNGRNRVALSPASAHPDGLEQIVSKKVARPAGRILVVDDELEIRELLANWLEENGYTVVTAGNAADALHVVETDPTVELLFTDTIMPSGLDGFDLGRRVGAIQPEIKTLYMSGYVRPSAVHPAGDGTINLLQKPFRLGDVLDVVAVALAR